MLVFLCGWAAGCISSCLGFFLLCPGGFRRGVSLDDLAKHHRTRVHSVPLSKHGVSRCGCVLQHGSESSDGWSHLLPECAQARFSFILFSQPLRAHVNFSSLCFSLLFSHPVPPSHPQFAFVSGGALYALSAKQINIHRSSFHGNLANADAGALYFASTVKLSVLEEVSLALSFSRSVFLLFVTGRVCRWSCRRTKHVGARVGAWW